MLLECRSELISWFLSVDILVYMQWHSLIESGLSLYSMLNCPGNRLYKVILHAQQRRFPGANSDYFDMHMVLLAAA